jgi:hypothetical protein
VTGLCLITIVNLINKTYMLNKPIPDNRTKTCSTLVSAREVNAEDEEASVEDGELIAV